MTLNIPQEYESVLKSAVANGAFPDAATALRHALDLLAEEQRTPTPPVGGEPDQDPLSHQKWLQRYHAMIARHKPTGYPLDDSRESIYPDRT